MKLREGVSLLAVMIMLGACSEEREAVFSIDVRSEFQMACEMSHGTVQGTGENMHCVCDLEVCDAGLVCSFLTKKCPGQDLAGSCVSGDVACSNGSRYTCEDDAWTFQKECSLGCQSDRSECAECDESVCTGGSVRHCVGGKYSEPSVCVDKICADEHRCERECLGDEVRCYDGKMQRCQDAVFVDEKACPGGCNSEGTACYKECEKDEIRCIDGRIKKCINDVFNNGTACSNDFSCKSDTECGECVNGAEKCVDDDAGKGVYSFCENGSWSTEACEKDGQILSCAGNQCGVCRNNDFLCEDKAHDGLSNVGFLSQCVQGAYEAYIKNGKTDSSGFCYAYAYNLDKVIYGSCNSANTDCGECLTGNEFCISDANNTKMYDIYSCKSGGTLDLDRICDSCDMEHDPLCTFYGK